MELSGTYVVLYKHPEDSKRFRYLYSFIGRCQNFTPNGLCAFSNEKNEMLLVNYNDIVQMKLKNPDLI
ncbi:hypothetical protein M2277_005007 [Paenibacillus sp. LBL]|nr:hypothetical protein [Paenibacillus sp. LBL]